MSYEIRIIEMFLKNGANPNFIIDDESPLHKAVNSGNVKLVEMLLDNGADPNIIINIEGDIYNYTPLNIACQTVNIPIIKLLLKHGANPNDNNDETNLTWIFMSDDVASVEQRIIAIELFVEYGYIFDKHDYSYLIGLKDDEIEIAKILLQYVQDPNIKNKALLKAAENDQPEMVKLMLDNGTDPNTINDIYEDTPLMYAINNKNLPLMILLLDRGADPHYVYDDDYRKYNMLQLARSIRFRSGLEYLETYISEKNKMQNREQRLATSMALNPRLGQESLLDTIDDPNLFDKITGYLPEYNTRYAPDVGRRMMLEDKQMGRGKRSSKKCSSKKRSKRKSFRFY